MAGQQRGLGALPRPVLGHAAAHLAVRRRARPLRRVVGRAVRAGRARRHRRRSPPTRHRRGHLSLHRVRRRRRGCGFGAGGGTMRRVEPVIDAWFDSGSMPSAQWGYPLAEGLGRVVRLPGRLHLRGHRPDPGLVLLAAGRQHPGAGHHALPQRARVSATWSTPTAARCPRASATSSIPGRSSTPGGPIRCGGGCSPRVRRGLRPGSVSTPSTPPCGTPC